MTIREIARLAEVSVSTVSKIMNGKDQNISSQTKERVLRIVKENNYVPYSDLRASAQRQSLLIGVLAGSSPERLLPPLLSAIRAHGYSGVVHTARDAAEERAALAALRTHHVAGVVWERCGGGSEDESPTEQELRRQEIPFVAMDAGQQPGSWNLTFDYRKIAYAGVQALAERRHQRIACAYRTDGTRARRFVSGYQQGMYDSKLALDAALCRPCDSRRAVEDLMMRHPSAVLCYDLETARMIYQAAARLSLRIPQDLSVLGVTEGDEGESLIPQLSAIRLPWQELAEFACDRLMEQIEKKRSLDIPFAPVYRPDGETSMDVPNALRNTKIVVVGTMNMDTLVNVGCYPKPGETILARSRTVIPGGKGVNQAIGAARLGAEVHLIGKVGKDYDGSVLYDFLQANNVNVQAVETDPNVGTGHAYVYVKEDGESGIVIYDGANKSLLPEDVGRQERFFENASFCLLQTEIRMDTVEYAAKLARKKGLRVLLKPAVISRIPDSLLAEVDIFLPNRNELRTLYPGPASLEQKAQSFLDRGVRDVIVTLGHRGCYWRRAGHSQYFPAADFEPVDTTGAADAFAATLAVYLSRHYDMETAIRYATYAAGASTTRQGVPPSLVDQSTLELYFSNT